MTQPLRHLISLQLVAKDATSALLIETYVTTQFLDCNRKSHSIDEVSYRLRSLKRCTI